MTPPFLSALIESGRKRRILTRTQAERLTDYALGKGLTDTNGIRSWLASADGLHPDLAKKLAVTLPPPQQRPFGPYLPLAHLADGGMGSVWLAAKEGGEMVVVKTIKPASVTDANSSHGAEALRRFEREARITRQLSHPNVVCCLDAGVTENAEMYLVLEYVDSGDLRDLVDAKGGLTEALALAILYQVADGLAEADRLKLVHRDIKPPNIFVGSNGQAKLADFGIARSTESTRTMLTMEGATLGSPMYMSPEQILTDPSLDVRSDIYALGAVLYFCLAADPPYNGRLQEILHQHCTAPIPDIRSKRGSISNATHELIVKSMAKDRKHRFQTPTEFRTAIGQALASLGMQPGGKHEESTALRDFAHGTAQVVARDIATLTADLRKQSELDELGTITNPFSPADVSADTATVTSDLSGRDQQVTLTGDLSGGRLNAELTTMPVNLHDMATTTAVLLAQEPGTTTPPPARDPVTSATVLANDMSNIARIVFGKNIGRSTPLWEGDPSSALVNPWLTLAPFDGSASANPDHPLVFLFAQPAVRTGKLREAPVDLCLRNYPVPVHKEACQRLSRNHLVVRYDALGHQCLLEDLNAPNGTRLDGIPMTPGSTVPLVSGVDNIVELAGVVVLWLRCLPRSGPTISTPMGMTAGPVGLDSDCRFDAVTMTRPENRSELAYAQVLRRISLGGPGADLAVAGARTRAISELAIIGGRWWWRVAVGPGLTPATWRPLTTTTELDCGGRLWRATPACHEQYG
jgi:serine/threonine protein kinase